MDKEQVITAMVDFLYNSTAGKSISLAVEAGRQTNDPYPKMATEWARLRIALQINGWASKEEVERQVRLFLVEWAEEAGAQRLHEATSKLQ